MCEFCWLSPVSGLGTIDALSMELTSRSGILRPAVVESIHGQCEASLAFAGSNSSNDLQFEDAASMFSETRAGWVVDPD